MKKKYFICLMSVIIMAFVVPSNMYSQKVCFNYIGSWSPWENCPGKISKYVDDSGLVLRSAGGIEFFKFQIDNYRKPSKKDIKEHYKHNMPFYYYGTVDYYVSDRYPSAEDFSKASAFVIPNPRTDQTPKVF